MMCSKLGLFHVRKGDEQLVSELLDWMSINKVDYTNTFRALSQLEKPGGEVYQNGQFQTWFSRWQNRLEDNIKSNESSIELMESLNPAVIPRNHKVEEALESATAGNLKPFKELIGALEDPYTNRASLDPYKNAPKPGGGVYKTFCGT